MASPEEMRKRLETDGMERRTSSIDRVEGRTLHGYAARYDNWSNPIFEGSAFEFKERIQRGAFDESIAKGEVSLFWQHNREAVLANQSSGTLKLFSDDVGLRYEATLGDTPQDDLYLDRVARGIVREMSFGFNVPDGGDSWNKAETERTLLKVRLREISVVERGAYPGTSAGKRAKEPKEKTMSKLAALTGAAFAAALATASVRELASARGDLREQLSTLEGEQHEDQRAEVIARLDDVREAISKAEERAMSAAKGVVRKTEIDPEKSQERSDEQRDTKQYRDQFLRWARGHGPAPEIREILTTSSSGILVPKQYETEILKYADANGIIRNKSNLKTGVKGVRPVRVNTQDHDDYSNFWTTEASPASTVEDMATSEVNFTAEMGYAECKFSTAALVQSDFDLEAELLDDLKRKVWKGLEYAYSQGTGSGMPTGVFKSDSNTSQLSTTAAHGGGTGWDGQVTLANLQKLRYKQLPAAYWPGAEWYMSQDYYYQLCTLVDTGGRPLFTPDANAGVTKSSGLLLLGAPVNICAWAPPRQTAASTTVPCIFANLNEANRIHEWAGLPLQRDDITTKGRVRFIMQPFAQAKLTRAAAMAQHKVALT